MTHPQYITLGLSRDHEYAYFRKVAHIDSLPDRAEILVAVHGHGILFVNDEFVGAMTGRHPGRIPRFDVRSMLKTGINVIAVKTGGSYFWTQEQAWRSDRGFHCSDFALHLLLESGTGRIEIVTDSSWRGTVMLETEWCHDGHDDSGWERPEVIAPVSADEYARYWQFAALWKGYDVVIGEALQDADRVAGIVGSEYCEQVEASELGTVAPARAMSGWELKEAGDSVVFDFDRTVVGNLQCLFPAPVTAKLRFEFDTSEDIGDFSLDASARAQCNKLAIEETLRADVTYLCSRRRAFRFIKITMLSGGESLDLSGTSVRQSVYPVANAGFFRCSDKRLNQIWETSRYTLRVNMHQEYESCPRHEMLGFSGDVRLDGLMDFYLYGDGSLLKAFFQQPHAHDLIHVPGRVHDTLEERSLWDYPAWWNIALYDYYLFSNDQNAVQDSYPIARLNAQWYAQKINSHGLLYQRALYDRHHESAAVVEYTCARNRLGHKVFLNALVANTFEVTSKMAMLVGDRGDGERYAELARTVRYAVNAMLWSEEHGAYRDDLCDYIPQDGNALALVFGLADSQRSAKALQTMKDRLWSPFGSTLSDEKGGCDGNYWGNRIISPFMSCYEAEARFRCRKAEDGIELIRRCWGAMLDKGARTFWEYNWNDATGRWPFTTHAWSAGPAYLLPAWVLGVRPISPGFTRVTVSLQPGDLKWVKGTVPTPFGLIAVNCQRQDDTYECVVSLPDGIEEAVFCFPGCLWMLPEGGEHVDGGGPLTLPGGTTQHILCALR